MLKIYNLIATICKVQLFLLQGLEHKIQRLTQAQLQIKHTIKAREITQMAQTLLVEVINNNTKDHNLPLCRATPISQTSHLFSQRTSH